MNIFQEQETRKKKKGLNELPYKEIDMNHNWRLEYFSHKRVTSAIVHDLLEVGEGSRNLDPSATPYHDPFLETEVRNGERTPFLFRLQEEGK